MDNDIEVVKDSDEVSVIIKTADQTRKADITVPKDSACSEIISGAIENWNLDAQVDYTLMNFSQNVAIDPKTTVEQNNIKNGDELHIQPVLVAGHVC